MQIIDFLEIPVIMAHIMSSTPPTSCAADSNGS